MAYQLEKKTGVKMSISSRLLRFACQKADKTEVPQCKNPCAFIRLLAWARTARGSSAW